MHTYRRVLVCQLSIELRTHDLCGSACYSFLHQWHIKFEFIFGNDENSQNVANLRLTEVIALMGADLCARSQTPPSLPSSPPYEGICGIWWENSESNAEWQCHKLPCYRYTIFPMHPRLSEASFAKSDKFILVRPLVPCHYFKVNKV